MMPFLHPSSLILTRDSLLWSKTFKAFFKAFSSSEAEISKLTFCLWRPLK